MVFCVHGADEDVTNCAKEVSKTLSLETGTLLLKHTVFVTHRHQQKNEINSKNSNNQAEVQQVQKNIVVS